MVAGPRKPKLEKCMPEVKKAAKKPTKAKPAKTKPEGTRQGVKPPSTSHYEFKAGEQVCLVNLKRKGERRFRSGYEYVRRAGKMDVIKSAKTGEEHHVWLNKLMPMRDAQKLQKELEAKEAA